MVPYLMPRNSVGNQGTNSMLTRQKILLRILADAGGKCTKIQLTKLSFLLANEGRSDQLKTFYEFLPYLYGPYSFTLNHEIDSLVRFGYVKLPEENDIELTNIGKKNSALHRDPRLDRDFELLHNSYGSLSQNALLTRVYEKYPWYTANSKSISKRKSSVKQAQCANYTVGYQSFQVDGLLNHLLHEGIAALIDTRSNPISRRFGFHKSTLQRLCKSVGIVYTHIPELGVPSSWRQELDSEAAYQELFRRYTNEILSEQATILKTVAVDMKQRPTALLCREKEPKCCHRSFLAEKLKTLNGLKIIELGVANAGSV